MYLHNDKDLFEEVINEANTQTGISQSIIEKDYYVTMILKLLVKKNHHDIVILGGTSLSKCYHLINRFSEDIDIAFFGYTSEVQKKGFKYDIIKSLSENLSMPIMNWNITESEKDYLYYLLGYHPISDYPIDGVTPNVKLKTTLVSNPFLTEEKEVESIIYSAINDSAPDIVSGYGLEPFPMHVQSVNRTFIDKIYALCDYYIEGKAKRYSRHLYDICKIYPAVCMDASFMELAKEVRNHRSQLSNCLSAKDNIDIKAKIIDFLDTEFYKSDYDTVTKALISDNLSYEQASITMREIANKMF